MKQPVEQKVATILQEGYPFGARATMAAGLELVQRNISSFLAIAAVMIVAGYLMGELGVVGMVLNAVVLSPLLLGSFFLIAHKVKQEEPVEAIDLLASIPFAAQLILFGLLSSLVLVVVFSPTLIAMYSAGLFEFYQEIFEGNTPDMSEMPETSGTFGLVFLLNFIPFVYLMVAFYWGPLFILFRGVPFFRALELSRLVVTKNWWAHFRLMLLFSLIITALLLLVSPLMLLETIFTIATQLLFGLASLVYYSAVYTGFMGVVGDGTSEEENNEDLLDHLIS